MEKKAYCTRCELTRAHNGIGIRKDEYIENRVGATAHMTLNKGDLYLEITESLENEKMTYRLEGTFDGLITYSLEPVEKGTKLTYGQTLNSDQFS